MPGSLGMVGTLASVAALMVQHTTTVEGHAFQMKPISRQYSRTREFNNGDVHPVDNHADAYNGGGPVVVKERQYERTDPDVLERYGGGDAWPPAAAWELGERMSNNNFYESDEMGVSHGVCGDTPQSQNDAPITYSTPNKDWEVLASYEGGSVMDMDIAITNYHWGHLEFFVCCSDDLDDPEGVVTQECFNRHPLNRASDDSFNSPIDPDFPGRTFLDPPCRIDEVDQTRPYLGGGVLDDGSVMHTRYMLPEITCGHAILQMRYHSGKGCKYPGYDEFNPTSWGSQCAPDKEDWIELSSGVCHKPGKYGNVFWNCSDIELTGDFAERDSTSDSEGSEESTSESEESTSESEESTTESEESTSESEESTSESRVESTYMSYIDIDPVN